MRFRPYPFIVIFALCASCTAATKNAVISRFPAALDISGFSYFYSDYLRCTFAEVEISAQSSIDQSLIDQSHEALATLRRKNIDDPFRRYVFPEGGFAYFQGRDVGQVASDLDLAGDRGLGYNIGEEIFSAKSCWENLSRQGNDEQRLRYRDLISNSDVIVIIGEKRRHTTIVYLPEHQRAYYFGP